MTGGCNKPPATPATQPAPKTRPATMPSAATFVINGQAIVFDAPRAAFDRRGGTTRLLLYSDKQGPGGTFYFEMPVDAESLTQPQEWQQRTSQKQREDALIGIDLPDRTLQPVEIAITATAARNAEGLVEVKLQGRFLVYAPDSDDAVGQATVEAQFVAGIETEAK